VVGRFYDAPDWDAPDWTRRQPELVKDEPRRPERAEEATGREPGADWPPPRPRPFVPNPGGRY
jgi:hypothetical protein